MKRPARSNGSLLVSRTATALIDLSLAATAGDYLGAESDLLRALAVSRPTLRQAAKIVESERMISVRRGSSGGFFAARPDAIDVIRAPARFLRLQGATLVHIHAVTRLISEEVGAAAAACTDAELRSDLTTFRAGIGQSDGVGELIAAETMLARLLAAMSGNPAAQLFIEIGYTFGRDERRLRLYQTNDDRNRARELQTAVCDAVLAGDAEVARLMMRRRAVMVAEWLENRGVQSS